MGAIGNSPSQCKTLWKARGIWEQKKCRTDFAETGAGWENFLCTEQAAEQRFSQEEKGSRALRAVAVKG